VAVGELHVLVVDALPVELLFVLGGVFVEAEDGGHPQLFKELGLLFCGPQPDRVLVARNVVFGAHEGQEAFRHDPVQIPVFYLLLLEVEIQVEGVVIVPAQLAALLQAAHAVFEGAALLAVSHVSVTEGC